MPEGERRMGDHVPSPLACELRPDTPPTSASFSWYSLSQASITCTLSPGSSPGSQGGYPCRSRGGCYGTHALVITGALGGRVADGMLWHSTDHVGALDWHSAAAPGHGSGRCGGTSSSAPCSHRHAEIWQERTLSDASAGGPRTSSGCTVCSRFALRNRKSAELLSISLRTMICRTD